MNRATYCTLLHHIEEFPELQPAGPGRRDPIRQTTPSNFVVCCIDTTSKIADSFGISESTAVVCRDKIIAAILRLSEKIIAWPDLDNTGGGT